jgi:2-methylisocitrate lyase-like PEP mutase family enzyme
MSVSGRDRIFHDLHWEGLLILPNAWDAGSARLIELAGAKAIATSSAAVAWAHGYPDGEAIPADALIRTLREIVRAVNVPVSADIEQGYARDPDSAGAFAARVMDAGAVGVNIEDARNAPDRLCARIESLRRAADRVGVGLWINARVDVHLHKLAEGEAAYGETVSRASLYAGAGANSIFVPGVSSESVISNLVRDVRLPLNLLAWPGLPDARKLRELGVRRLSAGAGLARAMLGLLREQAEAFLRESRSALFAEAPFAAMNINALMKRD